MLNNIEKKILVFILSFFMIFSNLINVFGYEWDLDIPPIINEDFENVTDNTLDNQVIINGNDNASLDSDKNINNDFINDNDKENIANDVTNENDIVEEPIFENGNTFKVKIEPLYYNKARNSTYTLVGRDKGADATVSFKGDEAGAKNHQLIDYITRHNGDPNSVGYCISPFYAGAKENGTTTVTEVQANANDKILLGIAIAGYPSNKYNIAGLNSLTEEEQYYATLIAMEHFLFQNYTEYKNKSGVQFNGDHWNNTRWFPNPAVSTAQQQKAQQIINVAKEIYAQGKANPYDPEKGIATINFTDNNKNDGSMKLSGDKFILTITLNSDTNYSDVVVSFDDPKIKQLATGNTKIQFYDGADENGTRLNWGTHKVGNENIEGIKISKNSRKSDNLTIVLNKEAGENLIAGNSGKYTVDYKAKFFGGNMQVGVRTRNVNNQLQDYAIITTGSAKASNNINWNKNTTTPPPPTQQGGKGGLKILKYNAKTNQLVADAIFKVRGISDGVYDFNVQIQASNGAEIPLPNGGKAVCKDGVIEISNINVGTYEITEITPPPNFDLAIGQNSQTVQVENQQNATLYPQVRFMNNPYGSLKIKKIDAITGQGVQGAVLKISNPLFNYEQEVTTGAGGEIEIQDLKQGSYEITEVKAPDGYVLSNETKVAVIKWGEETEITYENQPKTSLEITKIDSETGDLLDGARFKLKHTTSGAEYFTDPTANGVVTIDNLVDGTYVLTEIQAPNSYILNKTPVNVVIQNNKVNQITIKNSKKPSIKINKVDEETKAPLAGAKFEVWRAENNTTQGLIEKVGEYYTDQKGEIEINNLDYGWYQVKEIQAPQGYILDKNNYKFVFLEPNQTGANQVAVTFENAKKPSVKIIKRDIDTKDLLQGAKFEVYRAENNTTQGLTEKVGEYFTDDKGEIVLDIVDYGWYCIKEIQAPNGYLLSDDNVKFVFLEPNQTGQKTVEVIFENTKKPDLTINKVGSVGKEPLKGAKFSLFYAGANKDGAVTKIGDYITDDNGQIKIPTGTLKDGWYKLQETEAPQGYEIQGTGTYEFFLKAGESKEITIENIAKSGISIKKVDADTGEPLAGAHFSISIISDGNSSGSNGTTIANVITNSNGVAVVTGLKAGGYVIEETKAPQGYVMVEKSQTVWLNKDDTSMVTVTFENRKNAGLGIKKLDSITKEPLANATFKVTDSKGQVVGTSNGIFRTDEKGFIHIPNLNTGAYIIQEIQAPDGYVLDNTPQTVHIEYGKLHTVEFFNTPKTSILIKKYDNETKELLQGARFKVTNAKGQNVGNGNGIFTTNMNGTILVPDLKAGSYIIQEIEAPQGYILDSTPQTVQVENGKVYTLDFYNKKSASLLVKVLDKETREPIPNALVKVTDSNGALVNYEGNLDEKRTRTINAKANENSQGYFRTNENGYFTIPNLAYDTYFVEQVEVPKGYTIDRVPKSIKIQKPSVHNVEIVNPKLETLTIIKLDRETKQPLANAIIKVTTIDDKLIGEYRTDTTGTIIIPNLKQGSYKIQEIKAPDGYVLDDTAKLVHLKQGEPQLIEIFNSKKAGIQIFKRDSKTATPLQGAKFEVRKVNGELIGTNYISDSSGMITISGLEQGWYTVKEITAPKGYALNNNAQNVEVKTNDYTQVIFENDKLGSIRLKKIDYVTKNPIAGVKFKFTKENGENVGEFVTDAQGEINLVDMLEPTTYLIEEIAVPQGYALDKGIRKVKIEIGTETMVKWENYPLATLEITKIDERTKKPINGVEFELLNAKKDSMGKFTTDNKGRIYLESKLAQGTYYLKETKAKDGYIPNEEEKAIQLKWGKTTKIEFVNTPIFGQIEIHKIGSKNNQITGQLDGDNLQGAEFTIYEKSTGKEVTKVVTNSQGIARTGELPYGEYIVKETKAPAYYVANENEFEANIKENKEVIKLEIQNMSVDLKTGGEKSTVKETKAGDTIRYDFNNIQNLSSVALEDFYIHESLPSAIGVQRLFTGTFNQNMKYKIVYKTNKMQEYKVLKDNLFTDRVYEIDLAKGLQKDEYITDLKYEFERVGVGFREVEKPFLYAKVNKNVKKNEQFTNILTVGGRYDMQTIKSEDKFTTTVISTTPTFNGKLPKTGY